MRSIITKAVLAAGAMLLCAGGAAEASTTTVLKAKVPFAFTVNGRTLPAGTYTVERDDLSPVLFIRGDTNVREGAVLTTIPDGGHDPAKSKPVLTFEHREGQYRLAKVWESDTEGWDILGR